MKIKLLIISLSCILIIFTMNSNLLSFNIEEKIIYETPRGTTLEEAFIELEKISNDYIIFYFDSEINLSEEFRLAAREETFESVLNLILYLNNLKTTKISSQLYYVYPADKEISIEDDLKIEIPFIVIGIVQGKHNVATLQYKENIQTVKEKEYFMGFLLKDINKDHIILEYRGKEYKRYINEGRYEN